MIVDRWYMAHSWYWPVYIAGKTLKKTLSWCAYACHVYTKTHVCPILLCFSRTMLVSFLNYNINIQLEVYPPLLYNKYWRLCPTYFEWAEFVVKLVVELISLLFFSGVLFCCTYKNIYWNIFDFFYQQIAPFYECAF